MSENKSFPKKIISGGQSGADRAAFDFALENHIEIDGFIPKDRRAEDGKIPLKYKNLTETETENYAERTQLNVKNSDATLILSHGKLAGGSLLTKEFAEKHKKPFLHIDLAKMSVEKAVENAKDWLDSIEYKNLNVAGSRNSEDAKIYEKMREVLEKMFSDKK